MSHPAPVVYAFEGFRLDPRRRVLTRADGQEVEITAKVFDALVYFVERAGTPVSRAGLLKALWPNTIVEDNSLHRVIMALRRALGDSDEQRFIATLPGRGYQFVAEVRTVAPSNEALTSPAMPASPTAVAPNAAPARAPARHRGVRSLYWAIGGLISLLVAAWALWPKDPAGARLGAMLRSSMVSTYPGTELGPTLSPNGDRVAFSWNSEDDNRDIYITQTDGGVAPQRLTTAPEPDRDPAWSPDGARIVFLRQRTPDQFDIYLISVLDRVERKIGSTTQHLRFTAPKLTWTADSRHVIYSAIVDGPTQRTTRIHALALDTGRVTVLTVGDDGTEDSAAAISPDGQWLFFRREPLSDAQPSQVLLQRLVDLAPVGPPTAVPVSQPRFVHSPAWSPDGRSVTFVQNTEIVEWHRGDAKPRVVYNASQLLGAGTAEGEASAMTLVRSAIGARAVVARIVTGADIWALPLDPKTHVATGAASRRFVSTAGDVHPQFSPDGSRVAFSSNRSSGQQIWLAPADESGPPVMLTHLDVNVALPHWSPDGRQIAFHVGRPQQGERDIYVIGAEEGLPRRLPASGASPWWSHDAAWLYYSDLSSQSIARLRMQDEFHETLFKGVFASETPDGRQIVYGKLGESGVFVRSLGGNPAENPETRVVADHAATRGGIVPVADGFFYSGASPEGVPRAFRFYDYATGESRDIAPAPVGLIEGMTVSPDATELLYAAQASENGADLVLLEFDNEVKTGDGK